MYDRPTPKSNFDDVGDFHEKFGLDNTTHHDEGPREVPEELLVFRMKFLLEETLEFFYALGYKLIGDGYGNMSIVPLPNGEKDHALAFDALLDLAYVTFGAAHLMGYPWQQGWDRVQQANITKERATRPEQSERGGTYDVIKPPGWTPPDIENLLAQMGWEVPTNTNGDDL